MKQTSSNENTHSNVYQAQRQFWAALQHKDRGAFERLLTDDFISRSPEQPNQDRTAFIDTLTSFPAQVVSIGSDDLEVHVSDSFAVVTGVQSAQLKFTDGHIRENRIAITNVFQQREGRWLLKFSYAVSLD
jgi:ketosteroid isomerase-like protein